MNTMTNAKRDVEELKRMQSDAEKRRAERKGRGATQKPEAKQPSETTKEASGTGDPAVQDTADEGQVPEPEPNAQHFADQLAGAVKQLEGATREHPALALLAAVTTGIVIGNLLSRR